MGHKRVQGSFRKLPSGRWQVRYTGPDGLRHTMGTTFATRKEADQGWSRLAANLVVGQWASPITAVVSIDEYATQWIDERSGLAPRTRDLYRSLLRLHITPTLGQLELRAVTPAAVRTWRDRLLKKGVGESTVAKAYRLLRSVLATAVDDDLLPRNPCRLRGAATERPPERPVLTLDQINALVAAIEPRYRLLVLLAVFGSLRWGELMGLQRGDIDLNAMTVQVSRSVSEVGGELVVKAPKSAAGVRRIALPTGLRDEVRAHLDEFAEPGRTGRVFVGPRGQTLRRSNWTKIWRPAKKAAGIPDGVHLHDLRHTGNHLAAASGASTKDLMTRMGHSSMRAALIYQHATEDRDRAIADTLDRMIQGGAER